jgi:HK97 family phage portal protein
MWPFTRRRRKAEERAAWMPGRGPDGFGGDPFWSWGSLTGSGVSPQIAESVAAVGAAVSAIASTLASLPAAVVRADEVRDEVPTHDLAGLIRDGVNDNETWPEFIETLVSTTLLRGNAAASIDTDARGRLMSLTTLPWPQITVRVSDGGTMLFDYLPLVPPGAGRRRTYARDDLLWLRDRSDDGLLGVPRLQRAAGAMAYAVQIQSTAQSFSANLARPGGLLTTDQNVSDDNKARLKQEWDSAFGQRAERGKTAVLSGGMKWQGMSLMSAEDAQLVEARQWSVGDVARIFGVSPWLLGDSTRMTFASAREAMRSFAMLTLSPWANRVEKAFQATVLGPQFRLRFDVESLAKADSETLYGALLRGRQGGWLSPNDCREETGWPRSADPTADSIEPPAMGGSKPGEREGASSDSGKIISIEENGKAAAD